jgi:hypothetical protein
MARAQHGKDWEYGKLQQAHREKRWAGVLFVSERRKWCKLSAEKQDSMEDY